MYTVQDGAVALSFYVNQIKFGISVRANVVCFCLCYTVIDWWLDGWCCSLMRPSGCGFCWIFLHQQLLVSLIPWVIIEEVRMSEVRGRKNLAAGDDIHTILCVLEWLNHGNQSWQRISLPHTHFLGSSASIFHSVHQEIMLFSFCWSSYGWVVHHYHSQQLHSWHLWYSCMRKKFHSSSFFIWLYAVQEGRPEGGPAGSGILFGDAWI